LGNIPLIAFLAIGFVITGAEYAGIENSLEHDRFFLSAVLGIAGSNFNTANLNIGEIIQFRSNSYPDRDSAKMVFSPPFREVRQPYLKNDYRNKRLIYVIQ